jgi:Leucine-rich repeat (LRR) protein
MSQITTLNLGSDNGITTLTSFDGGNMTSLTNLYLGDNQLTSLDVTNLTNLITPSVNDQILQQLNQHGLSGSYFNSINGRTAASNADYNNLISLGWIMDGLDLITPPVVGSGRLAVRGFRPTP